MGRERSRVIRLRECSPEELGITAQYQLINHPARHLVVIDLGIQLERLAGYIKDH
jgi:hypothetical protein